MFGHYQTFVDSNYSIAEITIHDVYCYLYDLDCLCRISDPGVRNKINNREKWISFMKKRIGNEHQIRFRASFVLLTPDGRKNEWSFCWSWSFSMPYFNRKGSVIIPSARKMHRFKRTLLSWVRLLDLSLVIGLIVVIGVVMIRRIQSRLYRETNVVTCYQAAATRVDMRLYYR